MVYGFVSGFYMECFFVRTNKDKNVIILINQKIIKINFIQFMQSIHIISLFKNHNSLKL